MIPFDCLPLIVGVLFYTGTKLLCYSLRKSGVMYKKQQLSSIPEKNETEEEVKIHKWVPKKKHEVLKAKYKCLKKLFQIYDASVIGILPGVNSFDVSDDVSQSEERRETRRESRRESRRKKRSHRTKVDACAGTTEVSSGDVSVATDDKESIASAVIRDLKIQCSCSTQKLTDRAVDKSDSAVFKSPSLAIDREYGCTQTLDLNMNMNTQQPTYIYVNERKPTRFQIFLQRLFGLRRERQRNYLLPKGHVYAASDNDIVQTYVEKRRRRGPRFRRLRRVKKTHSEVALNDLNNPMILSYVQSVQRYCLLDRTPRQCPFVGCKMIYYGIINYNDHLNLNHFPEKRFFCHYCHEGFEQEYSKFIHEDEHLGITKLNRRNSPMFSAIALKQTRKVSNTQTEPEQAKVEFPEEKLKKIVSFFDKIGDTEQMLVDLKKQRYSEFNLQALNNSIKTYGAGTESSATSDKRTVSCGNFMHMKLPKRTTVTTQSAQSAQSQGTSEFSDSPVKCHICGESFDFRRQLSLHVDLEHRVHDKFSKFHSCAGIADYERRRSGMVQAERGKINIQCSSANTSSTITPDSCSELSQQKSSETLRYAPSTNIIYYESLESVKKPSAATDMDKIRSRIHYHWEPGTKIIRV